MAEDWRQYQQYVADVFISLGADAKVEAHVEGARGGHDIDLWVTFKTYGVEVRWVVECKLWKTAVPKEKVVALYQIAQDVGADRALLFSESGFQAGAIKATENTNVSLTNLAEFRENLEVDLFEATLVEMLKEAESLHARVKPLWIDENGEISPIPGADLDELIGLDGAVLFFKLALQATLNGQFPVSYPEIGDCQLVVSDDYPAFLKNAAASLSEVRDQLSKYEPLHDKVLGSVTERVAALALGVEELCTVGEHCLFADDDAVQEQLRLDALGKMKAVGRACQSLYCLPDKGIHAAVRSLLNLLGDTVYLYLTLPTIPSGQWDSAKVRVDSEINDLKTKAGVP